MGIQINGQTDTISASDGGLAVSGYELTGPSNINVTGIVTTSQLNVGTGGTVITTTASGLVGINSTSPAFPLDCDQASSVFSFRATSGSKEIKIGANDPEVISVGAPLYLTAPASQDLILRASGSEKLRITSTGQLQATGAADVRLTLGSGGTPGTNDSVHIRADGANLKFMAANGGSTVFERNGTETLRIDSSGRVTMPYQPLFYTTGTNYTQATGSYTIIQPNALIASNGSYSGGQYTAPVAGYYIFGFWGLSYPHNTEVNQILGHKNGAGIGQVVQWNGSANQHALASGTLMAYLSASDTFDWRYYRSSGSAAAYSSQWNMWGYLVG